MKKNIATKRGQGTARKATTSSTAQQPTLAKLLSGVMNHPDTPAKMYNSIQDILGELEADVSNQHSPEFIARVLVESGIQADPAQVSETTEDADEASEPQPTNDELQRGKAFDYRGDDNPIPRLTWKRAEELADIIVVQDEDESAAAFIELITGIAYERDHIERDNTASSAARVAFSRTVACNDGLNAFSDAACMRVAPQDA